jgi:D-aspartate ligase
VTAAGIVTRFRRSFMHQRSFARDVTVPVPGRTPLAGRRAGLDRVGACVMGDINLVRPLGLAGIPCAVVTGADDPALFSRYGRPAFYWDDFEDDQAGLLEALMGFGTARHDRPVLYYQQDAQLLLISRHRSTLSQAFRFLLPDGELVEDLVDKARFQALAERLDLPVPVTRRLRPAPGAAVPELDLRYPVILKPLTRLRSWEAVGGMGKALRVDGPEALRALWPRLCGAGMDLLAQELVPGPENRIESYHVYVDARGHVAGEFTGRKIRTFPRAYGHSTALTVTDADGDAADVAALGRGLAARLNLRGVAKFDFKRAPDGRLYLLEVNPRFSLWHHLGAVAGVNLPALVHADLMGLPRPPAARARPGVCWSNLRKDRLAARGEGVPLAVWALWALRCEAKALSLDDPMPFLRNLVRRFVPGARGR